MGVDLILRPIDHESDDWGFSHTVLPLVPAGAAGLSTGSGRAWTVYVQAGEHNGDQGGTIMTWTSLSDAPTITAAQGFYLEDDDEAAKLLHDFDTWLGDILEDNGGEPDGPAWIVFPLDDAAREELRRLGVVGQEVGGYVVEAYTADAHLSDYAEPWMGSTKNRVAFFVAEADARRAVHVLEEARADS